MLGRALLVVPLLAGCAATTAIVDGKAVPRLQLELTGQPYHVVHRRAHPRPGGPSGGLRDDGGSIGGEVCGMQLDFGVEHRGDHVQLTGFVDGSVASSLSVRDHDGRRAITGNLGSLGVDLRLTGERLEGSAGLRVVALERDGDRLRGFMRLPNLYGARGAAGAVPAVLDGREALWALPAADQALLLPTILSCYLSSSDRGGVVSDFHAGFGGPATSAPAQSSALYRRGR